MTTLAQRGSGTPATNGTTWATVTNAVDGAVGSNPATYATWTNAVSGGTGYIEIGGYSFASIPADATINSVTVSVRSLVSTVARITSLQYQPYDGATPLGTIAAATLTTTAHNDQATFAVTMAQLKSANFKIRINAVHAANTQSLVLSIDYADVTVVYTSPLKQGSATTTDSWALAAVGKEVPKSPATVTWTSAVTAVGKEVAQGSAAVSWSFSSGGPVYTDDFNRADGALGGNWEHTGWQINANKATRDGAGSDYVRYTTDLGSPDHWVEVDVPGVGGGNYMVVNARGSGTFSAANAYLAFIDGNNGEVVIGKISGGGYIDVARGSTYDFSAYRARLEVEGTAIRFYRNGALILSTTDSTHTTGNLVGLNTNDFAVVDGYDNFRTGTFAGGAVGVAPPVATSGSGSASVAWTETVTAAGKRSPKSAVIATDIWSPAAVGKKIQKGFTSTIWDEALTSAGKRTPKSAVTTTTLHALTAAGKETPKAAASTAVQWSTVAQGTTPAVGVKQGSGLALHAWAPSAVGKRTPKSVPVTTTAWALTAAGKKIQQGVATTTAWVEAVTSAGKRTPKGSNTVAVSFVTTAAGKRAPKGAGTSLSFAWALTAQGVSPLAGVKQGTALAFTAWTPAAVGKRAPKALTNAFHTWAPSAAGKRVQQGTAAATHLWQPSAVGKKLASGQAVVTYDEVTTAAGYRSPQSAIDVEYRFAATAGGVNGIVAVIVGQYNGLDFDAMQYGDKTVVDWLMVPA